MKSAVEKHVLTCDACQQNKNPGQGYGHLPPCKDTLQPWEEVAVDLIGLWKFSIPGVGEVQIEALTIIDACTNLTEIVRIENKTAAHVGMKFEHSCLSGYPRPLHCIHDPGKEFVG